jgi:hypothetical protein
VEPNTKQKEVRDPHAGEGGVDRRYILHLNSQVPWCPCTCRQAGAVQDNQDTNKQEHQRDEVLAWQREQRSHTTTGMLSRKVTTYLLRHTYGGS